MESAPAKSASESSASLWEKPVVLINRQAGSLANGSGDDRIAEIRERFAAHGIDADLRTVAPESLPRKMEKIETSPPSILVVGGGDGTVEAGAKAASGSGTPLGILPLGTFNHAARNLRVPLRPKEAVDALVSGEERQIDLATVNHRPYLCVCVLGFYPEKIYTDDDRGQPWWAKIPNYLGRILSVAPDYEHLDLTLQTGSRQRTISTGLLAVANNPYRDAPGLTPEKDELDSGVLGVYISTHRTRRRMAEAGMAFLAGNLEEDPDLHIEIVPGLTITCGRKKSLWILVDGERFEESLPLEFSIVPRSLRVILPRHES